MDQKRLLAKAILAKVPCSPGRIGWASSVNPALVYSQRRRLLQEEFDDLFLRTTSNSYLYNTIGLKSIVCDENRMPLLQHSLIHDVYRDRVKASHVLNQRIKQHLKKSTRHPLITLHDRICYPLCNEGSGTWGHWIGHNLPRALIFLDAHPDGLVIVPKSYFGRRSSFGAVLAKYISKDSIYQAPENTVISIRHCASVDLPYAKGVFHPLMVEYIKKLRFKRSGQVQSNHYIKRAGRRRSIVNNSELEYALQVFNIRPVALDLGDVDHQLELWASSGLVMGVLGSDLVNMALGSPEAICAITPHWFGDVFFYGLASALGIIWNEYYGGVIHEEHRPLHSSTFNLDINEFCDFLNYALIGSS